MSWLAEHNNNSIFSLTSKSRIYLQLILNKIMTYFNYNLHIVREPSVNGIIWNRTHACEWELNEPHSIINQVSIRVSLFSFLSVQIKNKYSQLFPVEDRSGNCKVPINIIINQVNFTHELLTPWPKYFYLLTECVLIIDQTLRYTALGGIQWPHCAQFSSYLGWTCLSNLVFIKVHFSILRLIYRAVYV